MVSWMICDIIHNKVKNALFTITMIMWWVREGAREREDRTSGRKFEEVTKRKCELGKEQNVKGKSFSPHKTFDHSSRHHITQRKVIFFQFYLACIITFPWNTKSYLPTCLWISNSNPCQIKKSLPHSKPWTNSGSSFSFQVYIQVARFLHF